MKTKPTQHSVKELQSQGIQPDMLVLRTEKELNDFFIVNFKENEVYRYDMVSTEIAHLQEMLEVVGYHDGRIDGYFDEATRQAVRNFEYDYDLVVDGEFSKSDYAYLEQALISHFSDLENDACYQYILDKVSDE